MLYVKIDPKDTKTHWNISYYGICMSGAPQFLLRGSQGPWGAQKIMISSNMMEYRDDVYQNRSQ